jgi:nitrogen fixation NifU-like protein
MSDLRDLYQEIILDHSKRPRNFQAPTGANRRAEGHNPLCGDRLTVYLQLSEDGLIRDIGFEGAGCAISKASASLMTAAVKGRRREEAEAQIAQFRDLVAGPATAQRSADAPAPPPLGKLAVFAGLRAFPTRVKCATLAWHALGAALREDGEVISTE